MIAGTGWSGNTPPGWGRRSAGRPPATPVSSPSAPARWPDTGQALGELLARWDQGMVTGRRERRMAIRLAAERAALPDPAGMQAETQVAGLPDATARGMQPPAEAALHAVLDVTGDDEDPDEIFDDPAGGDFYADAFEVLE